MPEPTAFATTARRVVFFEDRAEVTRTGKITIGEGRQWVRLSGATLLLDDRSVQAKAPSGIKVLAARVIRRVRSVQQLSPDEATRLNQTISEAAAKCAMIDAEYNRTNRAAYYVQQLMQSWTQALAVVPKPGDDSPASDFERAFAALAARDDELLAQQLDLLDKRDDANALHSKHLHELSTRNLTQQLFECFVEVQLEAAGGNDIELEIKYRTPCALWRPEHMARLERGKADGVEWTTWGVAWQRTGETWDDIEIAFSTARPAQIADAPNISDDNLSLRKKTPEERKQVVVQMREESIKDAGASAAPEMPGVDDGGKPLEFAPKGRYSLPNTGQPTRVEILRTGLKATVTRTLIAERAQTAFLKAEATWSGDAPILAGPLKLARGSAVVGRSRIKFVGSGEKFEVGFGPEDGIRAKRAVSEERETAKLTGAQTIKREVTLRLSNLGNESRDLEILERIPVSEIEGLEVKLAESKDWKLDKDGYLTHTLQLPGRANTTLEYEYEIRAKSNVVLPF